MYKNVNNQNIRGYPFGKEGLKPVSPPPWVRHCFTTFSQSSIVDIELQL